MKRRCCLPLLTTGIAATLIMESGRTALSLFEFPIPLLDTFVSSHENTIKHDENLKKAKFFIIHEVTMLSKGCFDLLLRETINNRKPLGEKFWKREGILSKHFHLFTKIQQVPTEILENTLNQVQCEIYSNVLQNNEYNTWLLNVESSYISHAHASFPFDYIEIKHFLSVTVK